MKKFVAIVFMNLVLGHVIGQYTYWEKTIGGQEENGQIYSNVTSEVDEIVAFGFDYPGGDTLILRKYNLAGDLMLENDIPFPLEGMYDPGRINTFQNLPNNDGYMAVGSSRIEFNDMGYVVKMDSELDTLWCKYYDLFPNGSTSNNKLMIRDSTTIVLGQSWENSPLAAYEDTYIFEMDLEGNLLWLNTLRSQNSVYGFRNQSIIEVDDGYIIGGRRREVHVVGELNFYTAMVTKVDFDGNIQWELFAEDPVEGHGNGGIFVNELANGEVIMTFEETYEDNDSDAGIWSFWTKLKVFKVEDYGSYGAFYWEQEYFTDYAMLNGFPSKVIKGQDGGFLILGASSPFVEEDSPFIQYPWLLKLDSLGNQQWFQEYSYYDPLSYWWIWQWLYDIEPTSDGGYVMAGHLEHHGLVGSNEYRSWLLKIDACGYMEWTGCEEIVGAGELEMKPDISVWPNPTMDVINIAAENADNISTIQILNTLGELIFEERNNNIIDRHTVDVSCLSSGMYFLKTINKSGKIIHSQKIIIE